MLLRTRSTEFRTSDQLGMVDKSVRLGKKDPTSSVDNILAFEISWSKQRWTENKY